MTPECRKRFRDFVYAALTLRLEIPVKVAYERANNIAAGVEADFDIKLREEPWNGGNESNEGSPSLGSGSSGPVGSASKSTAIAGMTGSGSRAAGAASTTQSETMAQHADRVIT